MLATSSVLLVAHNSADSRAVPSSRGRQRGVPNVRSPRDKKHGRGCCSVVGLPLGSAHVAREDKSKMPSYTGPESNFLSERRDQTWRPLRGQRSARRQQARAGAICRQRRHDGIRRLPDARDQGLQAVVPERGVHVAPPELRWTTMAALPARPAGTLSSASTSMAAGSGVHWRDGVWTTRGKRCTFTVQGRAGRGAHYASTSVAVPGAAALGRGAGVLALRHPPGVVVPASLASKECHCRREMTASIVHEKKRGHREAARPLEGKCLPVPGRDRPACQPRRPSTRGAQRFRTRQGGGYPRRPQALSRTSYGQDIQQGRG